MSDDDFTGSRAECSVRDGAFVDPCEPLMRTFGRGVEHVHLIDFKSRKQTRSFVVIKSGEYRNKGVVANCCPFCGVRIDAPINAN